MAAGDGSSSHPRALALEAVAREAAACRRCAQLAASRRSVVFGAGDPDAEVMLVGDVPSGEEDAAGIPLVGRPGALLDELLARAGCPRETVWACPALKCRPPGNREPLPAELAGCEGYLWRQLELIRPAVVVTLGGFATKLLRRDPAPIAAVRGRPEVRTLGPRTVRLLPVLHPAAALYSDEGVALLRADLAQLPGLLALGAPPQTHDAPVVTEPRVPPADDQLGLF